MTAHTLESLAVDAARLDVASFAKRHAPFFFALLGEMPKKTRVPTKTMRHDPDDVIAARESIGEITLFPIRRDPKSPFPFVSIGRLDGNDIALGDDTVSKFHAYVKADKHGNFVLIVDGRSQNGTFVDGEAVAQRGSDGAPTILHPGQVVRIGSVQLTYLDAASVWRLARSIGVRAAAFA